MPTIFNLRSPLLLTLYGDLSIILVSFEISSSQAGETPKSLNLISITFQCLSKKAMLLHSDVTTQRPNSFISY